MTVLISGVRGQKISQSLTALSPLWFGNEIKKYIYLITRVSTQYRELLYEWAWYFHEP